MWRKGPTDKPRLCNPCGVQYMTKKTLDGYMPGQKRGELPSSVLMPRPRRAISRRAACPRRIDGIVFVGACPPRNGGPTRLTRTVARAFAPQGSRLPGDPPERKPKIHARPVKRKVVTPELQTTPVKATARDPVQR